MTNTSTDIDISNKRIEEPVNRNIAPSGSVDEDILEFLLDVDANIYSLDEIEILEQLFGDLEYLYHVGLNEAAHFTKKSTVGARITARKWYKKNRGRVKKLADRLKKSKGLQKKKEVLAKSGRTLTKKKKKKYNTKNHINEYGFAEYIKENHIGENLDMSDFKFKQAIRKRVDEMFEPDCYKVVQEFTIGETEALLLETFEHLGGRTWRLIKHNGQIWKFQNLGKKEIEVFITED